MKTIESFMIDHTTLIEGMYTSRIDGDITTYDIRMTKPNDGCYLQNDAIHTIEHLFATYARNSQFQENIIYVGPMGCRTGFYLLVRNLKPEDAIVLVKESMAFIASYEGRIPGRSAMECGNFIEHNLDGAKKIAASMCDILHNWTVENLKY